MKKLQCKKCGNTESYHDWAQKPYCSPYCAGMFTSPDALPGEWSRHASAELKAHIDDVQQPLRVDGTINPHFVKVHGTKAIEKELKIKRQVIMENLEKYA